MRGASDLLGRLATAACVTGALSIGVTFFVHPVPDWVTPAFFASMGVFVILALLSHLLIWISGGHSNESPQRRLQTPMPVGNWLKRSPVGEHAAMHVYRDESVLENRVELLGGVVVVGVVASLPTASIVEGFNNGLTWGDALIAAFWVGVALAVLRAVYRHHYYGTCGEIRLSDDGTCELETKRRLIRLHVNEIKSVKYSRDDESDRESYTIRFQGGKLEVTDGMTHFPAFLAQLERMNPAVDLTSFPADDWPDLRTPEPAGTVNRLMRSALFPLVVILALAWIAIKALTGN